MFVLNPRIARRSGGMELLFGNQKAIDADMPAQDGQVLARLGWAAPLVPPSNRSTVIATHNLQLTVAEALVWARDNLLTERPELFMKGSSV